MKKGADGKQFAEHSPGARLDYGVNWMAWLATGETITDSAWECDDDSITLEDDSILGVTNTLVFAEGGAVGEKYLLTNTITTDQGRIDSRTIRLVCVVR